MTGPLERPRWHRGGRGLMVGSLGLAMVAVAVLALGAEDTRLLRLGIIAALWAALLWTFATAKKRREIGSGTGRIEELRAVYRLELEREIAARREHELLVERELREQAEESRRVDVAALHAELQSLRGALQRLLGGDVLVERVALRESTRLRPLPGHSRTVPAADAVSEAPRSVAISGWPVGHTPVRGTPSSDTPSGETRVDSALPRHYTPLFAEEPGEEGARGRRHDSLGLDPVPGAPGAWHDRRGAETGRTEVSEAPAHRRHAEPERTRDTGLANRSWSPAVSWTPSAVDSAVSSGTVSSGTVSSGTAGRGRRWVETELPEPEAGSGAGRHSLGSSYSGAGSPQPPSSPNGSRTQTQSVGAHRGGRSVHELLAAYGENPMPRHRRRRKDDAL